MSGETGPLGLISLAGPEWVQCWERLVAAVQGTNNGLVADDPGLPDAAQGVQMSAVERYAREVTAESNPRVSLGLTFPAALVAGSVATQGAVWAKCLLEKGSWLKIPAIVQSTVVAPSGYGKSTVMSPLTEMIRRLDDYEGKARRRALAGQLCTLELVGMGLVDTAGTTMPGSEDAVKEVRKIFESGYAARSLTMDAGTPEGVRDHLLKSGGVAAFLTAEPDILLEVSKYAKDSGTYRWFVSGWDAESVGYARANGISKTVPHAALPYAVTLQPGSFDAFVHGQVKAEDSHIGGIGASGAIGRGVYGRSWVCRIDGWAASGVGYGVGGEGEEPGPGEISAKDQAALHLEETLSALMERTDPYRTRMGVFIGWLEKSGTGEDGGMPTPEPPEPIWLLLADEAAWLAYATVQNIRLGFYDLMQQLELTDPGSNELFMPMLSRWTQHVVRIATVIQLTVDPAATALAGWAIRDAALRLGPWLFEAWCAEMRRFRAQAVETMLEQEIKNNPRKEDQTFQGQIVAALKALQLEIPVGGEFQVAQGTVVREAMRLARARARGMFTGPFNEAFQELVTAGALVKAEPPKTGKPGKPPVRWQKTALSPKYGF